MSKSKKQVKAEIEVKEGEDNNNNEIIETVEEVQENNKPKKKIVTEAMKEHLATIRVKALKVKAEKKALREKAKQLENAELELKADKYDKIVEQKRKTKRRNRSCGSSRLS